MTNKSALARTWDYLKVRKRYWLAPMVVIIAALIALAAFTNSGNLAPFIYNPH